MAYKLLVDDGNLQVGKAKYLGKFVDTGFNLIDEDEIVVITADRIVTNEDCTEEYYKLTDEIISVQIKTRNELEQFFDKYWSNLENYLIDDHAYIYKYRYSSKSPFSYTIDIANIYDDFEWWKDTPGRKGKFMITVYKVMNQEASEWKL